MNIPVIAFFNNKGGVGKTSLVYHLSWMFNDLGIRVLACDLDPQANLTAAFLEEDQIEELWRDDRKPNTVFKATQPLRRGVGDIDGPSLVFIDQDLALLPGDMSLSYFEDQLSKSWSECLDREPRAFRVESAFWRLMQHGARMHRAEVIFMDLGPSLGAINRSALISANRVVIPLAPDLFSLQGISNLGTALAKWREEWRERLGKNPEPELVLPSGEMRPLGYVVMQHSERLSRPVKAYRKWAQRIPQTYRMEVLGEVNPARPSEPDPHCLAYLKHYRSLMPMAQEARKPIFHLKPADGAGGSHLHAALDARKDFLDLAVTIGNRIRLNMVDAMSRYEEN